jgi:hypothetical protein
VLKPLVEEVGAPWAGFHSMRHSFASLQLACGVNVLQLSRALGHHSASFTLDVYMHLLEGDQAPALDLPTALGTGASGTSSPMQEQPDDSSDSVAYVIAASE